MAIPKDSDAYIIRIARKMHRLQRGLTDCISEISGSGHPNSDAIMADLYDQCWFAAWPEHVVSSYLSNPERWECDSYGVCLKRKDTE